MKETYILTQLNHDVASGECWASPTVEMTCEESEAKDAFDNAVDRASGRDAFVKLTMYRESDGVVVDSYTEMGFGMEVMPE